MRIKVMDKFADWTIKQKSVSLHKQEDGKEKEVKAMEMTTKLQNFRYYCRRKAI